MARSTSVIVDAWTEAWRLGCIAGLLLAAAAIPSGPAAAATLRELQAKSAGGYFARMWRTTACGEARTPRCPSVERDARGELLLLLAHHPEGRKHPVLGVARSGDAGRTWSSPRPVYAPDAASPRALGTLTRLRSGKLLAPLDEGAGTVRILASEDHGRTWTPSGKVDCAPLQEAVPYGRLIELDGRLLMSVFGKLPLGGALVPCSGLLRSADAGVTWGGFTPIACDRSKGKTAYGPTAIRAVPNGSIVALISANDRYVYRSVSADGGETWSPPRQRLLACNPALAAVGKTLACVDQDSQHRGIIRVQFSDNLFDSWRCDRMLDQDIKGQYASAVGLDDDRLLLVHDRGGFKPEGRGTVVSKGIEVVMMQRNPKAPRAARRRIPPARRDDWQLTERFTTAIKTGFREVAQGPDGVLYALSAERIYASADAGRTFNQIAAAPRSGLLGVLRSGRWIIASVAWGLVDWTGKRARAASDDGYAYFTYSGVKGTSKLWVHTSDDRGKTWHGGDRPADITPLVWVAPYGRFIEQRDGTVVMTAYGCLSDEDTSRRNDCCGLFRSTDGGRTWGDFSLVAYDDTFHDIAYNEMDVQPMSDGTWVAVVRTEWRSHHGGEASSSSVCFSEDRGRTWTRPAFAFIGAVPSLALLPDGGLVCATSFSKFRISYDAGRSWSRELPSYTRHYPGVKVTGENAGQLLLYDQQSGQRQASIYRRVPASQARVRARPAGGD